MKDTRTMLIKYYELKVKIIDDLDDTEKSYQSLTKKSLEQEISVYDKAYFQIWASLLENQLKTIQLNNISLDTHIEQLGFKNEIENLLRERVIRQEEIKKRRKLELEKEISGLPD